MHKKTSKTTINDLVEKMAAIRRRAAAERGEFDLFALFNRKAPGVKDQWDLIVAAPWLDPGNDESWAYITNLVNAMRLSQEEGALLYRFVILDNTDPTLDRMLKAIPKGMPASEMRDFEFSGVPIRRGFVIEAKGRRVPEGSVVLRNPSTGEVTQQLLPNNSGQVIIPRGQRQVI